MRERLEGLKLAELGRPEEEMLVLSRRMIQMGQAVYDRILASATATETIYVEGGPVTTEVVLTLPFFDFLTLKMTKVDGQPVEVGATYHPHGRLFNEYENVELGKVLVSHLESEPGEAASELTYSSTHIEDGPKWAFLVQMIRLAKERSEIVSSGVVH